MNGFDTSWPCPAPVAPSMKAAVIIACIPVHGYLHNLQDIDFITLSMSERGEGRNIRIIRKLALTESRYLQARKAWYNSRLTPSAASLMRRPMGGATSSTLPVAAPAAVAAGAGITQSSGPGCDGLGVRVGTQQYGVVRRQNVWRR